MNKILSFLKGNWQDILKPVTVLLVISLTNEITANKIELLEEQTQQKAMALLVKADEFDSRTFGEKATDKSFEYFAALKEGKTVAYIFVTSAKGYGGEVSVMTAVNTDGTVKDIAILDVSNETPGLGQNAKNESFYSQYKNKIGGVILKKNGADSDNNEVNAVTGATITSKAVTAAVNEALDQYETVYMISSTIEVETESTEITAEEAETVEEQ